jgi:tungstate transport system substrate-binding protein
MMKRKAFTFLGVLVVLSMLLTACAAQTTSTPTVEPVVPATAAATVAAIAAATSVAVTAVPATATIQPTTTHSSKEIILATTTSTRDSGLLDVLLPIFEQQSGYTVKMVAVGSGAALALGQQGNADVLLVHSPAAELKYMAGGFGKERTLVMHNDFIIVGPTADPAKISSSATAADAFKAISDSQSVFVSRADASGTNAEELTIWQAATITPTGAWYLKSGQGMGDTLRIASEKAGYTLTDRATYLSLKDTLDLTILYPSNNKTDKSLLNIYHVITVNPAILTNINYTGAKAFADWMVSADTQKLIAAYGVDKYGQQLFFPDAGKTDAEVQ